MSLKSVCDVEALAKLGDADNVRAYLSEHKHDPCDSYDALCERLMMIAASRGHTALLQFFLDCGVDPNRWFGFHGETMLTLAAKNNVADKQFYQMLLDAGADINHETLRRESAILVASLAGQHLAVKALLCVGANPNEESIQRRSLIAENIWGCSVAKRAANVADLVDVIETLILTGCDVSAYQNSALKSLMRFSELRNLFPTDWCIILQMLLDNGADPRAAIPSVQCGRLCSAFVLQCAYRERVRENLVDLCLLLKPLGLPVLSVIEIFARTISKFVYVAQHSGVKDLPSRAELWQIAATLKRH